MAKNLANGLDGCSVVVQPRAETTAKSMEPVPCYAGTLQRFLDALGPEGRQIQREYPRAFEDQLRPRTLFVVPFQFGEHVRQQMHGRGSVLRLRVDDFSMPHRPHHVQLLLFPVDVLPFQSAQFCQRQACPRSDYNRATRNAVYLFRDLFDFFERVLVRLPAPLPFGNLHAVCWVRALKRSVSPSMSE